MQPHQTGNLRATYFLATAFVGGLLSRSDEKRPNMWFARLKLPKPAELSADVQEHLANASKIICSKLNQDVTTLNTKNLSPWRKAIHSMIVLWKAMFSFGGSKMVAPLKCMPVLLMSCNESMKVAIEQLLYQVWNETIEQFTTMSNRYRGIKSRPKWSVLENIEYGVLAKKAGFGLNNPENDSKTHQPSANSVKAANLQDFLEESIVLRFASEFLLESNRDAEEHLDGIMKRKEKQKKQRKSNKKVPEVTGMEAQRQALDSFVQSTWTDDAEVLMSESEKYHESICIYQNLRIFYH